MSIPREKTGSWSWKPATVEWIIWAVDAFDEFCLALLKSLLARIRIEWNRISSYTFFPISKSRTSAVNDITLFLEPKNPSLAYVQESAITSCLHIIQYNATSTLTKKFLDILNCVPPCVQPATRNRDKGYKTSSF